MNYVHLIGILFVKSTTIMAIGIRVTNTHNVIKEAGKFKIVRSSKSRVMNARFFYNYPNAQQRRRRSKVNPVRNASCVLVGRFIAGQPPLIVLRAIK